jgi:hypothetical protein
MSTALWMLEEGGYDVTILDRAETLPAPDAASCGESNPAAPRRALTFAMGCAEWLAQI